VVAERLEIANGKCEKCGNPAPFIRDKDKTPYLEVHHKIQLSKGGWDELENTEALCPNCHREKHYG
jgi:5-methylcytosine-specific restriction protein A